MTVPLLDLKLQYAPLAAEITARIAEVCATQQFVLGRHVAAFEAAAAAYCRVPHALGVSDRKSTRLNSSHSDRSRMPSSA